MQNILKYELPPQHSVAESVDTPEATEQGKKLIE